MKDELTALLQQALDSLVAAGELPGDLQPQITLERTRDKSHGDLASNIALTLAKRAGKPPRDLAQQLVAALPPSAHVNRAEIAGPGFINFHLSDSSSQAVIAEIFRQGADFGQSDLGEGRAIQVEFVSANPTGPLHVGHGRGAAVGDCIARLLEATGWRVSREFYYNDAGAQINNLALSVQARCRGIEPDQEGWPSDGYRGEYIADVARDYLAGMHIDAQDQHEDAAGDPDDLDAIRRFAQECLDNSTWDASESKAVWPTTANRVPDSPVARFLKQQGMQPRRLSTTDFVGHILDRPPGRARRD